MPSADDDLALAHALADAVDTIAVGYFHQRLSTDTKADGSLVTEADRQVEQELRERLRRHRPADAFVGEESGADGRGDRRWFVDPIDGTASFVAGREDWRTLIALESAGVVTVGLVNAPLLRQRWWAARAGGAWTRADDAVSVAEPMRLAVTGTAELARATVAFWPPVARLPESMRSSAARLQAASLEPGPGPATRIPHGALLVAGGHLDAFVMAGCGPWDIAAFVAIVEEAGGRFSDVTGGRSLDTGTALFSNGVLHGQILECLG